MLDDEHQWMWRRASALRAVAALAMLLVCGTASAQTTDKVDRVDFGRDVLPIFKQNCISCHGAVVHQNGFRLDQRSAAMRGSTQSPGVIRPG